MSLKLTLHAFPAQPHPTRTHLPPHLHIILYLPTITIISHFTPSNDAVIITYSFTCPSSFLLHAYPLTFTRWSFHLLPDQHHSCTSRFLDYVCVFTCNHSCCHLNCTFHRATVTLPVYNWLYFTRLPLFHITPGHRHRYLPSFYLFFLHLSPLNQLYLYLLWFHRPFQFLSSPSLPLSLPLLLLFLNFYILSVICPRCPSLASLSLSSALFFTFLSFPCVASFSPSPSHIPSSRLCLRLILYSLFSLFLYLSCLSPSFLSSHPIH